MPHQPVPRRKLKLRTIIRRSFLLVLALVFLFESWLWNYMGRVIAWLVEEIPLERVKHAIAEQLKKLSPLATLTVFIIPGLILLPLKVMAVWLFAEGHFIWGVSAAVLAKAVSFGVSSFLFALCKDKLLKLSAIRFLYETFTRWYDMAKHYTKPYRELVKRYVRRLRKMLPQGAAMRIFSKLRNRVRRQR